MSRCLVALLLLTGCATTSGARMQDGWFSRGVDLEGPGGTGSILVQYTATMPRGWQEGMTPPGDFAFYNPDLGATLYADTSCGKRYHDAPLNILANHLVMGFADLSDVEQTDLMLDQRAALERTASGTLDGVPVSLGLTVLKKGPCVFDLIYIGHPDHRDEGLAAFRTFRDGFQARIDP